MAEKCSKFGIINFYNDLILPFEYNSIDGIREIINNNELMFDIINNSIYDNKLKLLKQGNKYGLFAKTKFAIYCLFYIRIYLKLYIIPFQRGYC